MTKLKIQYCSDLHIEFSENKNFLKQNPLKPVGDILLLAGDITLFAIMEKQKDFFKYISDNFKTTYWIPGNHEYYNSNAANRSGSFTEKIKDNIFLLNNTSVVHDDVKIVFSTLWSKISPANVWQIERGMNDFHVIKYDKHRFSATQFNQFHEESVNYLQNELKQKHIGKTVVVTHHVPTLLNYPPHYKGTILNEAFAVELFDFIEPSNIDYWIYGHHHTNTPDFKIGNTEMLTNQLGYVQNGENSLFKTDALINY
jgi:predicted phosphohydrolase